MPTPTDVPSTVAVTDPLVSCSAAFPAAAVGDTTAKGYDQNAVLQRLGPEPPTLDPHITVSSESALYVVEIYGGLVTIDRNLKIVPDLAEDCEISNGGKTYTFRLREDAKFHNGKPVTAQDFKWSLERASRTSWRRNCRPLASSSGTTGWLIPRPPEHRRGSWRERGEPPGRTLAGVGAARAGFALLHRALHSA